MSRALSGMGEVRFERRRLFAVQRLPREADTARVELLTRPLVDDRLDVAREQIVLRHSFHCVFDQFNGASPVCDEVPRPRKERNEPPLKSTQRITMIRFISAVGLPHYLTSVKSVKLLTLYQELISSVLTAK